MTEQATEVKTYGFQFTGNGREYFGIWIVNLALSIVTLGVYSAWAKVRTNRYFYGNTVIAGSGFDYTANPKKILIGRGIAVTMLIAYQITALFSPVTSLYVLIVFLLFVPLIYISSLAFKMRYSQWRNINFSFRRDKLKAYILFAPVLVYLAVVIGGPLLFGVSPEDMATTEETGEMSSAVENYFYYSTLIVFVGMILFPMWQCFYYRFVGNRTRLGNSRFHISLKIRSFYAVYLATIGLGMLAGLIFFFLFDAVLDSMFSEDEGISFGSLFLLYVLMMTAYVFIFAFVKTAITNLVYSNIHLPDADFKSTLRFRNMAWLYLVNTCAIILTLGLAIPWAKVRLANYRAENMFMLAAEEPAILRAEGDDVTASADAMTDIFDLDIGL